MTNPGSRVLEVRDFGRLDYAEALSRQFQLVEQRRAEQIPDTLLLLEHPPVITMGRNASDADILATPEVLANRGVSVHRINRGGEATYHGPGQIVGYPIINLYAHQRKLRLFIERMEQVFINLLSEEYGISATSDPAHRGVWVENDKITAIGIAVKRGITMHGFAFNVSPDLSHFDWIIPCGIQDRGVTSLERLTGTTPDISVVKRQVADHFGRVYGYCPEWSATTETT
jgi:lipoyl(octanoyl) transferase